MLVGLPYYLNIGDILIWQGELEFLKTIPCRCLNRGFSYHNRWRILPGTLILMQGGGNFGDLWRPVQEERLNYIQQYPNNPIVIFPVTCWYDNHDLLLSDAGVMAQHSNITICARDQASYAMLKKYFRNQIMLVPDMAFSVDHRNLLRHALPAGKGRVLVKRTDKELAPLSVEMEAYAAEAEVRDWPSYERDPLCWDIYKAICRIGDCCGRIAGCSYAKGAAYRISDLYFDMWCRQSLICKGVRFVSGYDEIITTRLHVAILAILLNKPVAVIDNSYGKNSGFFETWLSNVDGVRLIK